MLDVAVSNGSEVCSALFVGLDTIYLGLRKLDARAAEAFASCPARWLTWLEEGLDSAAGTRRRFLIKNVYLNPLTFGSYRGVYTRTGEADAIAAEDVTMSLLVQPSVHARDLATGPRKLRTEKDVEAVRSAIRQAAASAERPIVSAAAAHAALRVDPGLKATDWWGSGSFRASLALYAEDLIYAGIPTLGYSTTPVDTPVRTYQSPSAPF